jgi:FKBP-type peptidyl-prolyl cis-trans isomerase SlyD
MVVERGDFIKIHYTGRLKEGGRVFDTTIEKVAREAGIYEDRFRFREMPIVIGARHVIEGLDEALIGWEVGEKKVIEVPPEKGFGIRDPKLVKVVPLKDFKRQGVNPVPGMRMEADGKIGKVQSVGGGRVRVDFNYELAGKVLEYEVTITEKVNKLEEKIRHLLDLHLPHVDANGHEIQMEGTKAVITLSDDVKQSTNFLVARHHISRDIFTFLDGIDEVEFREVFRKPVEKPAVGKSKA